MSLSVAVLALVAFTLQTASAAQQHQTTHAPQHHPATHAPQHHPATHAPQHHPTTHAPHHHPATHAPQHHAPPPTTVDPLLAEISNLKQNVESIARQMMMQQLFVEERIRSDGSSGLKQIRNEHHGTKSYFSEAHAHKHFAGIPDFPNYQKKLAVPDNTYVLNGVEFRSRFQYFDLKMPSKTSHKLHATEEIPFPEVPPSVLSKHNITEQIHEMTEYFRAFKNQDTHIRSDFRKYFKPVVCYLEGAWMHPALGQRTNYMLWDEDTAFWDNVGVMNHRPVFLPNKIMKMINGTAHYGFWDYRILCHPIQKQLELRDFYLADDLAPRIAQKKSLYDYSKTLSARFKLARNHGHNFNKEVGYAQEFNANAGYTVLDAIMEEIPGKNNYPADLSDSSFGLTPFNAKFGRNETKLNTGYYHRWYKVSQKGAMGTRVNYRGYADEFLFVAQTNQSDVAPMSYKDCQYVRAIHKKVCHDYTVSYSYAIPLEIIWLTPLLSWNPYNLEIHHGDIHKPPSNVVIANGRNGGRNPTHAYNGTHVLAYAITPMDFYDPHKMVKGVLDRHGDMKQVSLSGTQTILPSIKNVGPVRLRYPIMPLHQESNAVYKVLDAMKEMVMHMNQNARFFEKAPPGLYTDGDTSGNTVKLYHYTTSASRSRSIISHVHDIYLDSEMIEKLNRGETVSLYTSINENHQHMVDLHNIHSHHTWYEIVLCDGMKTCFDGHLPGIHKQRS